MDAYSKRHILKDKVPIFTHQDLDANSAYPAPGAVACEILRRFRDDKGRALVHVSTDKPWGIESSAGLSQFVVLEAVVNEITGRPLNV